MIEPYFRNGGMIGVTLDFNSEETYTGGGGGGTVLTYQNNYAQEGTTQSPVTFSNVDFGTEAADRYIIVGYSTRNDTRTINSVTIGGVSATILVQQGDGNTTTGMAIAAVPTGTSGDVVVTLSGGADAHYLGVWSATGLASATPVATATSSGNGSDAGAQSFTMNTDANGFVIVVDGSAAGGNGPASAATVSANLTLRYDGVGTTPLHTTGASAGADGLTDGTSTTFEITIGDTNNNNPAVAATFEGTAGGSLGNKKNSGVWDIQAVFEALAPTGTAEPGQVVFTSSGSWVVPTGVTSISAVCVGAGGGGGGSEESDETGGGGGGGGLSYVNSIPVTPGETLTITVGSGGGGGGVGGNGSAGGSSSIFRGLTDLVSANGGSGGQNRGGGGGGGTVGLGTGGAGGSGGSGSDRDNNNAGGGGGAGGYSGNGGSGGDHNNTSNATSGSGGGGGGGGGGTNNSTRGGGGVGILGEGSNGSAGGTNVSGGGGSGGAAGTNTGGLYGGGGRGAAGSENNGSSGAGGAVRIIWGSGRAYPSTNVGDV